jgi:hypothetical protein
MFTKHKIRLYFDENFPVEAVEHFRSSYWKKRLWRPAPTSRVTAGSPTGFITHIASGVGTRWSRSTTILTTTGSILLIMVKAKSTDVVRVANMLVALLSFLLRMPFPRAFLTETKFIAAQDGAVMRGRHSVTRQVKSFRVLAKTTTGEVRAFFGYYGTT